MNQNLATFLAMVALLAIGAFNLVLGASNLKKRNRSRFWNWLRVATGFVLFLTALWFVRQLGRGLFG